MGEKGKREEMLRNYATLPNSARVAQCRKSHQPSGFHWPGWSVIATFVTILLLFTSITLTG